MPLGAPLHTHRGSGLTVVTLTPSNDTGVQAALMDENTSGGSVGKTASGSAPANKNKKATVGAAPKAGAEGGGAGAGASGSASGASAGGAGANGGEGPEGAELAAKTVTPFERASTALRELKKMYSEGSGLLLELQGADWIVPEGSSDSSQVSHSQEFLATF